MRKKQILALLAMILAGVVAMLVFGSHKGSTWPIAAVDATLRKTIAADPGIRIPRMQRTGGDIRRQRHPLLDKLSHALGHKPLRNQTDEYKLRKGSDEVRVIIYSSNDLVGSVEIHPLAPPSKLAERLRAELTAAHSGLPCLIIIP